jgi:hypothetical protein
MGRLNPFGNVVVVAFHLKMNQNNVFFLKKKKLFLISTHQNYIKTPKIY